MAEINYQDIIEKDILELLGAKNMSSEQKRELYTKMAEKVQERVRVKIHDALSEEDFKEWLKILDSKDQKKADKFLYDRGMEIPKMLIEEALIMKTELVELAKE